MVSVRSKLWGGATTLVWAVVIGIPFIMLWIMACGSTSDTTESMTWGPVYVRSLGLAGGLALVSVLLGWLPAVLWSRMSRHHFLWLWLLLGPLMLPRYVLYYAWTLVLSPANAWGRWLSQDPTRAQLIGRCTAGLVLALWTWPLAALILGVAYRRLDQRVWEQACMEARPSQVFWRITLPTMGRPLVLAFLLCFVFIVADFATFHLSGWQTLGTELAVLYQLTGSTSAVLQAAWPLLVLAMGVAALLTWVSQRPVQGLEAQAVTKSHRNATWLYGAVASLLLLSLGVPICLLLANLHDLSVFSQYLRLHSDALLWSGLVATGASLLTFAVAVACTRAMDRGKTLWLWLLQVPVFTLMLIPGSLVAVALLRATYSLPQGWWLVSWGLAGRFAGLALVIQLVTGRCQTTRLRELAAVDGASAGFTWRHVTWPLTWPVLVVTLLVVGMLSMTELAATMVLLPAGLPSFSQRLLNQMHYAREQQTIGACLVLFAGTAITSLLALLVGRFLGRTRVLGKAGLVLLVLFLLAGCEPNPSDVVTPRVVHSFGSTGRGPGEFMYPRAIASGVEQELFVIDKTGRVQCFDHGGGQRRSFRMPQIEAGKPTGLKLGPDNNLYIADTHYHRILVTDRQGTIVTQLGSLGEEEGCFIYPTDVAFAEDGRIFVSEYGGNDRISVFDSQGTFLYAFGSPEEGPLVLARPAALCVDTASQELYIADACHHRIVVVDYQGQVLRVLGELGQSPGQLRYPYDMTLLPDKRLVVCEYGNNRIQIFDRQGKSVAVYGQAGRELGQLAYPWGVTVDVSMRAYIVDAGNNRIQVWQL